jgi:hypothetical protein
VTKSRYDYFDLRRRFEPAHVSLAIVAESPPVSGKYFYDPAGRVTEPLFSALMKSLGEKPASKEAGLRAFRERGWILVDATYEPVNGMTPSQRDVVILRDNPLLVADLRRLAAGRTMPVVLVKANVCQLLEPLLQQGGFNVLNNGRAIYFPAAGQQGRFHQQFATVVGEANLL